VFALDGDGRIVTWSDSARRLYRYDAEEVLDRPVSVLFTESTADGQPLDALLVDATGDTTEVCDEHRRGDGSTFSASMTVSSLRNDRFDGYAAVCRDRTEDARTVAALERQNQRLTEFAASLAHDLRNPLAIIDGRTQLARETGDSEHFDAVDQTVDRMERLLDDLLRVAHHREDTQETVPTDVSRVVDIAWEGTGATVSDATLDYEAVPTLLADGPRLCELFENLFRNALQHAGDDVTVTVGPLSDGFFVADDGPGIDPALQDSVFDHGVTTSDEGTGYGLSIVRNIATAHGWAVSVATSEDGGARFEITGVVRSE
jgi:PAS domain S-box-containing protein